MRRLLRGKLETWHLLLVVVVLVALNGGSVLAKIGPNAFRPAGTFMVASQSAPFTAIGSSDTTVLSRAITVPTGKSADLFAFANFELETDGAGDFYGNIRLDSISGTILTPGEQRLLDDSAFNSDYSRATVSLQAFKYSVGAGTHTIYVNLRDPAGGGVAPNSSATDAAVRSSLVIIANIHD